MEQQASFDTLVRGTKGIARVSKEERRGEARFFCVERGKCQFDGMSEMHEKGSQSTAFGILREACRTPRSANTSSCVSEEIRVS